MTWNGTIFAIIIVIIGAFYWYEYRPSEISKSCQNSAEILSFDDGSTQKIVNSNLVNFRYQECLRKNGIVNTGVTSNYEPSVYTVQPAP